MAACKEARAALTCWRAVSYNQFCVRACWGDQDSARCEHIYDVLGCRWNMPSATGYDAGTFESCEGDNAPLQGVFNGSKFQQGEAVTPEAHPPAASSNCVPASSIAHGLYGESINVAAPRSSTTAATTTTSSEATTDSGTATTALTSSNASPTSMATSAAVNNAAESATTSGQSRAADSSSSNQGNGALSPASPLGATLCLSLIAVLGAMLA